ncbi:MAG: MAPEG family protein [Burkholderiales bacterium]|nr:MAPEG family protein [Burkholderiales bacterium]
MTIAKWCVLAACVLPIASVALAKIKGSGISRKTGGYDNNPRGMGGQAHRLAAAGNAAQASGFEALPLFIAGVSLAQMAQADQGRIDLLAMAFAGIRVAYVAAYLANQGNLRSLIWFAGFGVSVALLAMGA